MEAGWTTPIDIYCERTDPAYWSEPVNAITNAAFLLAALAAYLRWKRAPGRDGPALALILILTAIGIGSFLFHTFADRWSVLADVIPITIFIYVYFFFAIRRFFAAGRAIALLVTAFFLAGSLVVDAIVPSHVLNGSVSYLPALVAILIVGALVIGQRPDIGWPVLAAGAIFLVSLTFRSVDMAVCDALPLGTHFLWHMLNALTLYILFRVLMDARHASPAA
ncbi:ceramidase domain-containing protein [Microbaculum marinisediminis]|uniref:Ceramidase domain-containing protein n=1 Tax=Microbaculum marinisediminis TaxID=2931392 RepID=A0AAW5R3J4_9HYPH|nr:ceramidase domain-containing protein [Microbaculum sp. A6E488]MCT8973246.1 ceramidase domain-containing protein [Microbaculum sp. A6E488]